MKNKKKIVFIIFFIITFLISFYSKYKDGGDDLFYQSASQNYSFFAFTYYRYLNWSGRIVPEILSYFFNGSLSSLWPLLNSFFFTSLSILIFNYIKLLTPIKKHQTIFLAIIICLSFLLLDKTVIGPSFLWKTGSLNYLWPTTLAFFAIYPFFLSIKNKLINHKIFYFSISLFAGLCSEQISFVLILGLIIYFIFILTNKRKIPLILIFMALNIIIGSTILFLAPGNQVRFQTETQNNFYQFTSLSLFNRASISLYWILNKLINFFSLPLALIYLVLGVKTFLDKNFKLKIFSILSVLLSLVFEFKNLLKINYEILPITSLNYSSPDILVKYFFSFFVLLLIPYLIYHLSKKYFLFYFLLLLIILTTMFIVTLSPTLDVSGNRVLFLPIILFNTLSLSLLFQRNS